MTMLHGLFQARDIIIANEKLKEQKENKLRCPRRMPERSIALRHGTIDNLPTNW
jgi:hypothetical protein